MTNNSDSQRKSKTAPLKTLATLQADECRWPIGDPQLPDFHFCGARKPDGRPYCDTHAAAASTPSRPRVITFRNEGA